MGKISQNIWFFEFVEKLGQYFFLNLIHNESLYYLLNIDPIFGKNLLHQIWGISQEPNSQDSEMKYISITKWWNIWFFASG